MATFFTGDQHFRHAAILKLAHRPFTSLEEMDATLIRCWNKAVKPNDDVWHLGDFAWRRPEDVAACLNGRIHLIRGNHDHNFSESRLRRIFASVQDAKLLKLKNGDTTVEIYLHHYACRVWPKSHYGAVHLHGHSHGELPTWRNSADVGVDAVGYHPLTLQQALAYCRA